MATKKLDTTTGKTTTKTTGAEKTAAKAAKAAAAAAKPAVVAGAKTGGAAKAAARAAKAPKAPQASRHPHGRVKAAHGSKAELAKALSKLVGKTGEDAAVVESRLSRASNAQLIRLQKAGERLKAKWGSRDKLISAIGTAQNKSKDKDFLARLESYSLPQLLDLATVSERRAGA